MADSPDPQSASLDAVLEHLPADRRKALRMLLAGAATLPLLATEAIAGESKPKTAPIKSQAAPIKSITAPASKNAPAPVKNSSGPR
jgi:hypothetical protein